MAYKTKEGWHKYNQNRYYKNKAKALALKDKPCYDCGGTFPHYVLEWDHVPERGEKLYGIAVIYGSRGVDSQTFKTELAKCDLVCANCHKIRTHERKLRTGGKVSQEPHKLLQ